MAFHITGEWVSPEGIRHAESKPLDEMNLGLVLTEDGLETKIQKGSVASGTAGTRTVTFDTAFDAAPVVVVTAMGDSAGAITAKIMSVSATQFTYQVVTELDAATTDGAHWIAIGAIS